MYYLEGIRQWRQLFSQDTMPPANEHPSLNRGISCCRFVLVEFWKLRQNDSDWVPAPRSASPKVGISIVAAKGGVPGVSCARGLGYHRGCGG
jgi:hypothetical protein